MTAKLLQLRSLTSTLIQRAQWLTRHGITFNGARDAYAALGYERDLTVIQYRQRWERGDIAARIIECAPLATWRGSGEIVEDDDPDSTTEFEEAWDDLNERLKIWSVLQRADILAGIGRYSVILLGGKGDLSSELEKGKPEDLLYLQPFAEDDATILAYDTKADSPRFGLPTAYQLKRVRSAAVMSEAFGRSIHWSRIIHVADKAIEDNVFGEPRLKRVWNRLDDLDKVVGGGSEAFWLRANQGTQFDLEPDMQISPEEEAKLKEEVDEFVNGMRRFVRTRGMKIKTMGSDVANFDPQADRILSLIAGAIGIPKRILIGSEMGQLASSQDRSNWRDQIQDRRSGWAEPMVVRPLIDRLTQYGYLPTPAEYHVRWPTIQYLDESERADIAVKWANVNQSYGGEVVVEPNEIRDQVLGLEKLEKRAEAIVEPAPEVEPGKVPPGMKEAVIESGEQVVESGAQVTGDDEEDLLKAAEAHLIFDKMYSALVDLSMRVTNIGQRTQDLAGTVDTTRSDITGLRGELISLAGKPPIIIETPRAAVENKEPIVVNVTLPEGRKLTKRVERDAEGRIASITEE